MWSTGLLASATLFGTAVSSWAQSEVGRTKQKDVVILVDVSASVDVEVTKQAVDVATDMILGRFLRSEQKMPIHKAWEPQIRPNRVVPYFEVRNADAGYRYLKADYLRNLLTGEGELDPLTARSQTVQVIFFGDRGRTMSNKQRNPSTVVDLKSTLDGVVRETKKFKKFKDQTTHLRLALAHARKLRGEGAEYYLFLISDAQDDPAPLSGDDQRLIADWGPESNRSRDDHSVVVLEHRGGGGSGKTKPYICMVAVGFDPAKKDPVIEVPEESKEEGFVRLLGGLADGSPKAFRDEEPFVAWQVERLPDKELSGDYRYFVTIRDQDAPDLVLYGMNPSARAVSRLSLDGKFLFNDKAGKQPRNVNLPPGNWMVTIEEELGRLKPSTAYIQVDRSKRFPYLISGVAGGCSFLLFAYSWWAARYRGSKAS